MADINALYARRDSINNQLVILRAKADSQRREIEITQATLAQAEATQPRIERALARAEASGNNAAAAQARADIIANQRDIATLQNTLSREQANLAQTELLISQLESDLAAINAQINAAQQVAALPKQSASETAREDQAARADKSLVQDPPVTATATTTPTNAQRVTPQATTGTNDPVRRAENLQGLPPVTASPGGLTPGGGFGGAAAFGAPGATQPVIGSPPYPGATSGAAAPNDNQTNGTRAEINTLFGGSQARIVTQPNVLDKYTSYTYSISIYIMGPADYARLIRTKQKVLNGFQLLMQSGGAPLSSGFVPQSTGATDPGEIPGVTTQSLLTQGRNQFFPLDYYIDDLQLRSLVNGKGTGGAHNVVSLSFKLIEPNGITFIDNLRRATEEYVVAQQGGAKNQNYAAQHFLMVIRFYSYDEQGNLVACRGEVVDQQGNPLGRQTVIEKFIPFRFTAIKFRVADRLVEYQCEAVCPQININIGARGTIPYNMELQARTLQDLFVGNKVTGGTLAAARNTALGEGITDPGRGQIADIIAA